MDREFVRCAQYAHGSIIKGPTMQILPTNTSKNKVIKVTFMIPRRPHLCYAKAVSFMFATDSGR